MLIASFFSSCVNKKDDVSKLDCQINNDLYFYTVCSSGPILGPGEYVSVEFIGESGTFSCFGNNGLYQGMGQGRDGVARDRNSKYELPKAINAIWASYTDRKVYSLTSLIPYDTILELFMNPGEPCNQSNSDDSSYIINCLELCFLPKGKVILYVKGGAKTILLDWSEDGMEVHDDNILSMIYSRWGLNNIDEYFDYYYTDEFPHYESWRKYVKKHGSIGPLLERYLQRFNYTLEFEFESNDAIIDQITSDFTNGEQYWMTNKFNDCFKMPSRLKESRIVWNTNDFHYTCFMYFNEQELLKVFDEAYGDDKTQKGEIKIKVGKDNNLFDISLNVGDKSFKLKNTEIRVFQEPIDNITDRIIFVN